MQAAKNHSATKPQKRVIVRGSILLSSKLFFRDSIGTLVFQMDSWFFFARDFFGNEKEKTLQILSILYRE